MGWQGTKGIDEQQQLVRESAWSKLVGCQDTNFRGSRRAAVAGGKAVWSKLVGWQDANFNSSS